MANHAKVLRVDSGDMETLRARVRAKSSPARVVGDAHGVKAPALATRAGSVRERRVAWGDRPGYSRRRRGRRDNHTPDRR